VLTARYGLITYIQQIIFGFLKVKVSHQKCVMWVFFYVLVFACNSSSQASANNSHTNCPGDYKAPLSTHNRFMVKGCFSAMCVCLAWLRHKLRFQTFL
jgi:hypothetical protein